MGRGAHQDPASTSSQVETPPERELLSTTIAECERRTYEPGSQPGHHLLAINPFVAPYKPKIRDHLVEPGRRARPVFCICVDECGVIEDVKIIARTRPEIDSSIARAIWGWRYKRFILDGEPTPFCYAVKYTVR